MLELEKMTLATVDGAFELEIDSLSPDATRTVLVSIDLNIDRWINTYNSSIVTKPPSVN